MGKRGPKPKGQVNCAWSCDLAYAIGLIASDGCLSNDGRHITFVSKDLDQVENFSRCLDISANIGKHISGHGGDAYRVQFGDVLFCKFLNQLGLYAAKSTTIGRLKIDRKYFFHFLRGLFDGDGYFYSYMDPRWKSSFMFYTGFVTASKTFVDWLQEEIRSRLGISGHITSTKKIGIYYQLKYAKKDSLRLLPQMYYEAGTSFLKRKRLKIEKALGIIGKQI